MKSKLKAPGTKRLKQKYDNLLSSFAFTFNLRRYIEGIEVTDFRVDASVYVHTGATPAYAVAGSLKASASVGTMSAADAAAAGLGLSASGTLQISFNTRYSLELSMLTEVSIKEGSFQLDGSVGVSIGTCPHEGNFIEGTMKIKLSETQDFAQEFSGAVMCKTAAQLVMANPERDEGKCPITRFPGVADVVDQIQMALSDEKMDFNGDKLPAGLTTWTGGGVVPASCILPRITIKTTLMSELTLGPVVLAGAYADVYGWGDIKEPGKMTWAGEFFASIELKTPFSGLDVRFDTVGFGLKFDPQSTSGAPLSVSPIATVMTASLDGDQLSFSGRMYAIWPCELGMTALFWADIKIVLKDMFEADINVFASYFCGVKTGKLMHVVASLPLNKKIKIAHMLEITNLQIDASVGRCRLTLSNPR